MTRIYLIRHAEAEGNLYRRVQGQYNSLVTERGLEQIKALEERFRDVPIDAVYSSDLYRTKKTASAPPCRTGAGGSGRARPCRRIPLRGGSRGCRRSS